MIGISPSQNGPCLKCCRSGKTMCNTTFPIKFTVTYKSFGGHTWAYEACCLGEYYRIKKIFKLFAHITPDGWNDTEREYG